MDQPDYQKRTWAEIHLERLARQLPSRCVNAGAREQIRRSGQSQRLWTRRGAGGAEADGTGDGLSGGGLPGRGAEQLRRRRDRDAPSLEPSAIRRRSTPGELIDDAHHPDRLRAWRWPRSFSRRGAGAGRKAAAATSSVDTGMTRLGVLCDPGRSGRRGRGRSWRPRLGSPAWTCEGVVPCTSPMPTPARSTLTMQIQRYNAILHALEERGCTFKLRHCCAGAATLNYPQAHYDMIRPGILLYGYLSRSRLRWHDRRQAGHGGQEPHRFCEEAA